MAEVRRATAADTEALIAMGRALHAESPRYRGMRFDEAKLRRMADKLFAPRTFLGSEDCAAFVAVAGGEVVGMCVAMLVERWFGPDKFATDLTVYIKPEHRGGSGFVRMIKAFEAWAPEQGVTDLVNGVSTEIDPQRAVRAYEKLGWTLSGYTVTKTLHGD